jgi:hypothetical protein
MRRCVELKCVKDSRRGRLLCVLLMPMLGALIVLVSQWLHERFFHLPLDCTGGGNGVNVVAVSAMICLVNMHEVSYLGHVHSDCC